MDRISKKIAEYLQKLQKDRRLRGTWMSLAVVVVFATTYALILPAITMDHESADSEPGIEVEGAFEEGVIFAEQEISDDAAQYASEDVSSYNNGNGETLEDIAFEIGEDGTIEGLFEEELTSEEDEEDLEEGMLLGMEDEEQTLEDGLSLPADIASDEMVDDEVSEAVVPVSELTETEADMIDEDTAEETEEEIVSEESTAEEITGETVPEEDTEVFDIFEDASDAELETAFEEVTEQQISTIEFTGEADGVSVIVSADAGAFPEGTVMVVAAVEDPEIVSAAIDAVDGENQRAKAVDISFRDADDNEIEPLLPIRVTMQADVIAENEDIAVVHVDDEVQAEVIEQSPAIELSAAETPAEDEVVFEAESFSAYVLVYTVDFKFGEYEYHLDGGTSMLLSDLIKEIQLVKNAEGELLTVEEIAEVTFTDETLLAVEKTENEDWLLTSLQAFTSDEVLTITLKDGAVVDVDVTDAVHLTNITRLIDSIDIEGLTKNEDGSYTASSGDDYNVKVNISEKSGLQFNWHGNLYFNLPSGFIPKDVYGSGEIEINSTLSLPFNYVIDQSGKVTISFPVQEGDAWHEFIESKYTELELSITGTFDETADEVHFNAKSSGTVHVTSEKGMSIKKSGTYNPQTNQVEYTVEVTSTGHNENINIYDYLNGTALAYKQGSLTSSVSGTLEEKDGGFTYHIDSMRNGETVYLHYNADVALDSLTKNADGTYGTFDQTYNTVKAESKDNEPVEATVSGNGFYKKISVSDIVKNVDRTESIGGKKKTVDWTVVVNSDANISMNGKEISDTLTSTGDTQYYGDGIKITAYNKDGSVKYTNKVIKWEDIQSSDGSSWKYTFDDQEACSYKITYTTVTDLSDTNNTVKVTNKVEDEYGEDEKTVTIAPDQEESETGHDGDDDHGDDDHHEYHPTITKTHTKIDTIDKKVTWVITFTVPAEGYNETCELTDFYPFEWYNGVQYFDKVSSAADISVEGLFKDKGETYEPDFSAENKLILSFMYQNEEGEKVSGLASSDEERTITVTLTTQVNEEFLKVSGKDALNRTNTVEAVLGSHKLEASNDVHIDFSQPAIKKTARNATSSFNIYDNTLPYCVYYVELSGVNDSVFDSDGNLILTDTFDPEFFELWDMPEDHWDKQFQGVFGGLGNNNWTGDPITSLYVEKSESTPGQLTIKLSKNSLKDGDGNYYESYRLVYALIVKDTEALEALQLAAGNSEGGIYTLHNAIEASGFGVSETTADYKTTTISKTRTEAKLNEDTGSYEVDFTLSVNPQAYKIGSEKFITINDTSTNLEIDLSSVKAEPALGTTWNKDGNRVTFTVPNETAVTITYTARVNTNGEGTFTYQNEADLFGQTSRSEGSVTVDSSAHGKVTQYRLGLLKHLEGDATAVLSGVKFRLYRMEIDFGDGDTSYTREYKPEEIENWELVDINPENDPSKPDCFITDPYGKIDFYEYEWDNDNQEYDRENLYKNLWYKVEEVEDQEIDGQTYIPIKPIYFWLAEDGNADRENGIYLSGDVLDVSNTPANDTFSLKVRKQWDITSSDNVELPEKITLHLFRKASIYDSNDDAEEIRTIELTKDDLNQETGFWEGSFDDLDRGYAYFVQEDPIAGYTTTYDPENDYGYTYASETNIKNTLQSIKVRKRWENDTPLAEEIKVNVYRDGLYIRTITLDKSDRVTYESGEVFWEKELTDLKFPAQYTFQEQGSTNYSLISVEYKDAEGNLVDYLDGTGTATFKNGPHVSPSDTTTEVNVQKKWLDQNNNPISDTAARSEDLESTVALVRYRTPFDGVMVRFYTQYTQEEGNGKWILVGEHPVEQGKDINLSINVNGYWNPNGPLIIPGNSLPPANTGDWSAYSYGSLQFNADPSWTVYSASLSSEVIQGQNEINICVINGQYDPYATVFSNFTASPSYDIDTDKAAAEFDAEYDYGQVITLDESNDWQAAFTGLPRFGYGEDGLLYYYSYGIQERTYSKGFELVKYEDVNGNDLTGEIISEPSLPGTYFVIKNKKYTVTKDVSITKIWKDNSDNDVIWPDGTTIEVELTGSFVKADESEGSQEKNWKYQITRSANDFQVEKDAAAPDVDVVAGNKKYLITFKELLAEEDAEGNAGIWTYRVTEASSGYKPVYKDGNITKIGDEQYAVSGNTIVNKPEEAYELPSTGGPGTHRYIGTGIGLMLMAAWILYIKQKLLYTTANYSSDRRERRNS